MSAASPAPIGSAQPLPWPQPTPGFPQLQQPEEDGFSLGKLLVVIRRRSLWFGLTFGLVVTSIGAVTIAQWLLAPQYRGGFRLLVRDPLAEGRQKVSSELAAVAQLDADVNVPNLAEVLGSPMLLDPLAKKLGLKPGELQNRVTISRQGDSDVLNVDLLWNNPDKGTTVIEALAKEYLNYSLRQRREKLTQGLQFLDEQAPGLEQRVLLLQQELAAFRRANTMLAPEEQSRVLEGSRATLEDELRTLRQTEAQLKGLLVMVQGGHLVSPFQSPSTPVGGESNPASNIQGNFSPLLAELVDVEGQLAQLEASFKASSPMVRNLRARREKLRPLLQRREQDAILSALAVNRVQQDKVQDQIEMLGAEFRRNPELIKTYEALQQRLQVARDNLGSYLQARETFRLEVAQSTVPWQVISPPLFGVVPVEPNLQSRLMQGLLIGLAAGTAVAYLRDRYDRVFHSPREVEQILGLPLLTSVPYLLLSGGKPIAESLNELDPEEKFGLRESLRTFYQSMRMLRANRALRVVAITSSAAGEGKTTTTALLGQTLVDMGMKVLLIDADLRRARLHERLGLDNSHGLSELFGPTPPQLHELLQWPSPNLAVLTGGPRLPDPARLLTSDRCAEIIQQIRDQDQFDLIVFDTPPALELVDPLLISEHMDGLLLLVSLGRINRDLPAQVVRKVKESGVDLLGVVTTKRVDSISGDIGSDYGYGYGYGYSSAYSRYADELDDLPISWSGQTSSNQTSSNQASSDQASIVENAGKALLTATGWFERQKHRKDTEQPKNKDNEN